MRVALLVNNIVLKCVVSFMTVPDHDRTEVSYGTNKVYEKNSRNTGLANDTFSNNLISTRKSVCIHHSKNIICIFFTGCTFHFHRFLRFDIYQFNEIFKLNLNKQ